MPLLAEQNREGELLLDPAYARRKDLFLLRVKGESMIGAHIQDGDLVLVEPNPSPQNSDIVVAIVEGEGTLKRWFREEGGIRLQPANPTMDPILVAAGTKEVRIVGKVIGLLRSI